MPYKTVNGKGCCVKIKTTTNYFVASEYFDYG